MHSKSTRAGTTVLLERLLVEYTESKVARASMPHSTESFSSCVTRPGCVTPTRNNREEVEVEESKQGQLMARID